MRRITTALGFGLAILSTGGYAGATTPGSVCRVVCAPRIAEQWERAVILRLGRFVGLRGPGLFWIVPFVDRVSVPLAGALVASPRGWVINNETAGNNTIVGENRLGSDSFARFLRSRRMAISAFR